MQVTGRVWFPMLFLAFVPATLVPAQESGMERLDGQEPVKQGVTNPGDSSLIKIDEFRIQLGEQVAGFRLSNSGAITEIVNPFTVRKRGRYYGSVYEYHRNDNFDARNFFDPVGKKLPEFKRNQFGGSFGVFVSDRLTLFGTFDGLRINRGSTILSHVPTREMKRGDFSSLPQQLTDPLTGAPFQNNQIPPERIHTVASLILPVIPDPNRDDPFRNFVNNLPEVENGNTFTGRVDYEFSKDSKLFITYSLDDVNQVEVNDLPIFGATTRGRSQEVSLDYTHDFSENLVGSLQLQFSREAEQQLSLQAGQKGLLASLGIAGLQTLDSNDEGYPSFDISGYAGLGGDSDWPNTAFRNSLETSIGLTYVRGKHNLEFGAEIESAQVNNNHTGGTRRGSFEFSGSYSGDAFADFLLGLPNVAERGVGSDRADLRRKSWRLSARDDWKINPKFSLTLSLAYNYVPFYRSLHDNVATFAPLVFDPPPDGRIVVTGSQEAFAAGLGGLDKGQAVYPDRNDWQPGIGLAYSPLGNNRLVIRSSYQLDYNPMDEWEALDFIGRNYPFFYTERAESPENNPALNLSNPFQAATPAELNIRAIEPHLRNSYTQDWQLSIQNEFLRNWNVEVAYQGVKLTRGERTVVANVPFPGPGPLQSRRPNAKFGRFNILTSGSSASGNSLSLNVEKRVSKGFSLKSSYAWSRTFSDEYWDDPSNPRDLRAERAPDGEDSDQRLSVNYILDLPLGREQAFPLAWMGRLRGVFEGWRISGITTFAAGGRFNPTLAGDPNNDGIWGDRPDRLGSGQLDASQRSIDRWFATEDFAAPLQQYGFGNSGRNILRAPGLRNWDISFIKRTRTTDSGNLLEFRVQLFNAFNNTNLEAPASVLGTPTFGKIFGAGRAREIEIAVKYSF